MYRIANLSHKRFFNICFKIFFSGCSVGLIETPHSLNIFFGYAGRSKEKSVSQLLKSFLKSFKNYEKTEVKD